MSLGSTEATITKATERIMSCRELVRGSTCEGSEIASGRRGKPHQVDNILCAACMMASLGNDTNQSAGTFHGVMTTYVNQEPP